MIKPNRTFIPIIMTNRTAFIVLVLSLRVQIYLKIIFPVYLHKFAGHCLISHRNKRDN